MRNNTLKRVSKKAKPFSETGKFPWIWYLGDRFTITQAKARIKELQDELNHIDADPNYTPWKPELVNLETTFEVIDALRGNVSGDYMKDLKRLNRKNQMCSAALYELAYQETQQQ